MREELKSLIRERLAPWLKAHSLPELPDFTLEEPPRGISADLSCNLAMILAQTLKKPPRALAQEMLGLLQGGADFAEKLEIAGPGFVNIRLSDSFLIQQMKNLLQGRGVSSQSQSILLEFVSANPTGPLHVGHGRGAALGDSLARIFSHLGYKITREFYVNDIGLQMENLVASVLEKCLEAKSLPEPQSTWARELVAAKTPEDFYKGGYVQDLSEELEKILQEKSFQDSVDFLEYLRQKAVAKMLGVIQKDLEDFGVAFDIWSYESTVYKQGEIAKILNEYESKKLLVKKEGAVYLALSELGLAKDEVLERSKSGAHTYFAADIAYHVQKYKRGFDRLIDIWGADHHGHVERTKKALEALGHPEDKLTILLYQLVALLREGQPVPMGKRSGDYVTLRQVLEEVGCDAARFFFAMRSPGSHLDFDLELAKKKSQENPVYYVQYVHARISSIFRQAQTQGVAIGKQAKLELLKESEERELIKKLISFEDILVSCIKLLSPHLLTAYLLELAALFHRFYDKHRVLSDHPELTQARLALIRAVQLTIQNSLHLLGVSAPEKM